MLSSPSRLAILAALMPGDPVRFMDMKAATGLADGNLHVQTHKLADAGYIEIRKTPHGRRQITEFRLTDLGLSRLKLHVTKLQALIASHPGAGRPARTDRADDSAVWL